jgi:YidC/Oxa1 family membrane protein insertase
MHFFDSLLWPIMVVVAWIMVQFHTLLTAIGLPEDSGASWVLSIVGLVIVIRIVLIPLFVKQIKASRGLQMIQPQIKKLQTKYKGKTDPASRQAMQAEMMALYKENGTNPFASCLPILAQSPIFFALFRVLYSLPQVSAGTLANGKASIGPLTQDLAASAEQSTLFGAPLSSTFMQAASYPGSEMSVRVVSALLIILMSVTTFMTQRQLTMKNMPPAALDNPMAKQQKMLMYLLPGIFAVTGVNFPIGVLVYWFTTNVWTMGQQFYVIRRMPAPGSAAEAAQQARRAKRAMRRGRPVEEVQDTPADVEETGPKPGQRQQPKRKDRQRPGQASGGQPTRPAGQPPRKRSGAPAQGRRNTAAPSAEAARAAKAAREAAQAAKSAAEQAEGKSNKSSNPGRSKRRPGSPDSAG